MLVSIQKLLRLPFGWHSEITKRCSHLLFHVSYISHVFGDVYVRDVHEFFWIQNSYLRSFQNQRSIICLPNMILQVIFLFTHKSFIMCLLELLWIRLILPHEVHNGQILQWNKWVDGLGKPDLLSPGLGDSQGHSFLLTSIIEANAMSPIWFLNRIRPSS